jgi:hypothetical protein
MLHASLVLRYYPTKRRCNLLKGKGIGGAFLKIRRRWQAQRRAFSRAAEILSPFSYIRPAFPRDCPALPEDWAQIAAPFREIPVTSRRYYVAPPLYAKRDLQNDIPRQRGKRCRVCPYLCQVRGAGAALQIQTRRNEQAYSIRDHGAESRITRNPPPGRKQRRRYRSRPKRT